MIEQIIFSVLSLSFCISTLAESAWKWRAREHFEVHTLKLNSQEVNHRGLSNTINYWHEIPFDRAIGFAFGPIIGGSASEGSALRSELGRKTKMISMGVEYKKWISAKLPLFTRLGLYHQSLNTDGSLGNLTGTSYLVGFGYEHVFKGVGIAIELSQRSSSLDSGVKVDSFTPSIGFHFYPFL